MVSVLDLVRSFIREDTDAADFFRLLEEKPEITNWLQSIVPKGKVMYRCNVVKNAFGQNAHALEMLPYDIGAVIRQYVQEGHGNRWYAYYYTQRELYTLLCEVYPNPDLRMGTAIAERFFFGLDAIPHCIGEAVAEKSGIFARVMAGMPAFPEREKRVAWVREEMKKQFGIEGSHYPCWRYESAWPVGIHNKPMRFVSQDCDREGKYRYVFADAESGNREEVVQTSSAYYRA